jgi:hypothetical protein
MAQADGKASHEVGYEMRSGSIQVRAVFPAPVFSLFQDLPGLCAGLFGRLRPYGAALADMKLNQGGGSLGEAHLDVSLPSASTVVGIRLDRVEVNCFSVRSTEEQMLGEVVVGAIETVRQHTKVEVATYDFTTAVHGVLDGVTTPEYLARFVSARGIDLGPLAGVGSVLYFGPSGQRRGASVTIDLSVVTVGGLFLRIGAIWDGASVSAADLPRCGRQLFDDVTRQLALVVR